MGALEDKLQAIFDGMQQAASGGWSDELAPEISTMLPGPKDPEGTERVYAAGSPESDMRENMRSNSAELERRFPKSYASGKALGAAPGMLALPALSGPGAGLLGGAMGAAQGAGDANGQDVAKSAARNAGLQGLLGTVSGMVPEATEGFKNMLGDVPQLATAEARAIPGGVKISQAKQIPGGVQVNQMSAAKTAPARAGRGRTPVRSGDMAPADEQILREDRARWERDNPEALSFEEEATGVHAKPAQNPPRGDTEDLLGPLPKNPVPKNTQGKALGPAEAENDINFYEDLEDLRAKGINKKLKEGKPVKIMREETQVEGRPTPALQKTIAEGVNPDELGRLRLGMARGTHGPADMEGMRAVYQGKDPTEVATKHFSPVEMTVEETPTGLSWWLKDGRHRLQNAMDHGATAINANVRRASQEGGEPLFSGALPLKKSPAAEAPTVRPNNNPDDIKKYF